MEKNNYEEMFNLAKEYEEIKENKIYTNSEETKKKNKNNEIKNVIKDDLFNKYFPKYGEIINDKQMKNIIDVCVNSYSQDEGVNILISSEFKIKNALDLHLANMYRENKDNEIGLNILDLIERIYASKIEEKYPGFSSSEIFSALDECLEEYDGSQQFYINVVKKIKKNKIRK